MSPPALVLCLLKLGQCLFPVVVSECWHRHFSFDTRLKANNTKAFREHLLCERD